MFLMLLKKHILDNTLKRLRWIQPLIVFGLLFAPQSTVAANCVKLNRPGLPSSAERKSRLNKEVYREFGVHVYVMAKYKSKCKGIATQNAIDGTQASFSTGVVEEKQSVSINSSNKDGKIKLVASAFANQKQFKGGAKITKANTGTVRAAATLTDILYIDHKYALESQVNTVPIELCLDYKHDSKGNKNILPVGKAGMLHLQIRQFPYKKHRHHKGDGYKLDNEIEAKELDDSNRLCTRGSFRVNGDGAAYRIRMMVNVSGHQSKIKSTNMPILNGESIGQFRITDLPNGFTCRSESQFFPGCDNLSKKK